MFLVCIDVLHNQNSFEETLMRDLGYRKIHIQEQRHLEKKERELEVHSSGVCLPIDGNLEDLFPDRYRLRVLHPAVVPSSTA